MPSHAIRTLRQRGRLKPRVTIAVSMRRPGPPGPPGPPGRYAEEEALPAPPEIGEGEPPAISQIGEIPQEPEQARGAGPEDQVREGLRVLAEAHPWARSMLARFNALIEKAAPAPEAEGAETREGPTAEPGA